MEELRYRGDERRIGFELQIEGCRSAKAAAPLDDYGVIRFRPSVLYRLLLSMSRRMVRSVSLHIAKSSRMWFSMAILLRVVPFTTSRSYSIMELCGESSSSSV